MEQRLSVVTLGVADLEQSRRFYEEGLGWRRGNDHDEVVFFQLGGAVLALYPRHLLAEDARVTNDGQGFDGIALAYCARTRVAAQLGLRLGPGLDGGDRAQPGVEAGHAGADRSA
jgi:catechol 2,3-dioxygenase-like lactoylglutathione lyase family enzyme